MRLIVAIILWLTLWLLLDGANDNRIFFKRFFRVFGGWGTCVVVALIGNKFNGMPSVITSVTAVSSCGQRITLQINSIKFMWRRGDIILTVDILFVRLCPDVIVGGAINRGGRFSISVSAFKFSYSSFEMENRFGSFARKRWRSKKLLLFERL